MPEPEFFTRFRLLIIKGFFDEEICATLRFEAMRGSVKPAEVVRASNTVDAHIRRTQRSSVSSSTLGFVDDRLRDIRKQVEIHFHGSLTNHEEPQFLVYRKGDFYQRHRDAYGGTRVPEYLQARRISVVIFLNSQSEEPTHDTYQGGSLILYGLIAGSAGQRIGFPMMGQEGTLVAFPAETVHEVEPVTSGCRYSIVSWFYS